jgi:hypothetical protein
MPRRVRLRVPVRAADSVSRLVRRRSRWQLPLPAPQRKEDPNGEGCAAPQHGQDNAHADSKAVHSLSCCNLQCIGLQPTIHRVVTFRMRLALCSTNVHLIVTCCINVACTSSSAASSSSHIWRFASPSTAGLVCMLLPWNLSACCYRGLVNGKEPYSPVGTVSYSAHVSAQ